jgi:hypothetical protein
MTPREKAIELIDSFEDDLMECDTYFLDAAKQRCALIAVDEILQLCWNGNLKAQQYWMEVKQEIEKL